MVTNAKAQTGVRMFGCLIAAAAVLTAVFVGVVWQIDINGVDPGASAGNIESLWGYWLVGGGLWCALSAVAWGLIKKGRNGADERGGWLAVVVILFVAGAARVAVVFAGPPQLSDDIWRYIHDGRQVASGVNPYAHTPDELGAGRGEDRILDQINHPDLVTIYQPTSQVVFGLLWLARPAGLDPLGVYTFRVGFVLIDLCVVGLLVARLRFERRSVWWAVLYAWHPLVISEVAGSGHQDVIGIALLLGALLLIDGRVRSVLRMIACGVVFAGAVAVKPIVLPLALPMVWRLRGSRVGVVVAVCGVVLSGALLYVPFVVWGDGMGRLIDTGGAFVGTWSFNSSMHGLTAYLTGSATAAGVGAGVLLVGVLVWCVWWGYDVWRVAGVYLFAALLVSSTAYPWYLLWALALVPMRFGLAVWVYSVTIMWSYAVLSDMTLWRVPLWVAVAEYVPVYAVLGVCAWRWLRGGEVELNVTGG